MSPGTVTRMNSGKDIVPPVVQTVHHRRSSSTHGRVDGSGGEQHLHDIPVPNAVVPAADAERRVERHPPVKLKKSASQAIIESQQQRDRSRQVIATYRNAGKTSSTVAAAAPGEADAKSIAMTSTRMSVGADGDVGDHPAAAGRAATARPVLTKSVSLDPERRFEPSLKRQSSRSILKRTDSSFRIDTSAGNAAAAAAAAAPAPSPTSGDHRRSLSRQLSFADEKAQPLAIVHNVADTHYPKRKAYCGLHAACCAIQ